MYVRAGRGKHLALKIQYGGYGRCSKELRKGSTTGASCAARHEHKVGHERVRHVCSLVIIPMS